MDGPNPEPRVDAGAVDTHCHLFLVDRDPAAVVEAARAAGVARIVCVGIDPETSARARELADSLPGVFATAGMHPHDAATFDGRASARIEELLHDPRVVAVGECGLDYYRMRSPRADQLRVLEAHAALSREVGKPLVVHVRDAWDDVLATLERAGAERVVIHCFSGDAALARECATRGYYLSFAGNVTYPKNGPLREAARAVPSDRLLVETDAPFLAPQAVRGRENEPAHLPLTLAALARALGTDADDLARTTASNAFRAFPGLG
jgi:TatD DNase family protein